MNKKSATKISILLISILSCLLMFSCDNPSDENPDSEDTKTTEETKTVTHSAMIGTWVNPDAALIQLQFLKQKLSIPLLQLISLCIVLLIIMNLLQGIYPSHT